MFNLEYYRTNFLNKKTKLASQFISFQQKQIIEHQLIK
ncbi:hypothetical protein HMPREF9711_00737 [Myroides odoratimimus CCUG 3837]|nr:hypothetical protein HMPREF9711_00737 [Myroides odoratimimus CCUG 3837]